MNYFYNIFSCILWEYGEKNDFFTIEFEELNYFEDLCSNKSLDRTLVVDTEKESGCVLMTVSYFSRQLEDTSVDYK